jgi:drug/metabolite transporter (DMT)-like permease
VDASVAAAVLAASLLHASWHALVKSSGDRVVALAGMNLVSAAVALVAMPFLLRPEPFVLAVIGGSVVVHVGYKIALAKLYSRTDLSQGYPLARGLTPIAAAIFAYAMLLELPSAVTASGIVLIAMGVAGLVFENGVRPLPFRTVAAAVAAGGAVAAYSVIDAYGVRRSGDWMAYTAWLVACDSGTFAAYAVATRGKAAMTIWKAHWQRTLISGLLGVVSFSVFLWALGRAPVGAVAALRETSIVFAAVLGVLVLHERGSRARVVSVGLVVCGAAAISLLR